MRRLDNVPSLYQPYSESETETVTILAYDRDRYFTIRKADGSLEHVKGYGLTPLVPYFSRYLLPMRSDTYVTSKELAEDIRQHHRYCYKFLQPRQMQLRLTVKINGKESESLSIRYIKTRKQLKQQLQYLYDHHKDEVDFYINYSYHTKRSTTMGCLAYFEQAKGSLTVVLGRERKINNFIKGLVRYFYPSKKGK